MWFQGNSGGKRVYELPGARKRMGELAYGISLVALSNYFYTKGFLVGRGRLRPNLPEASTNEGGQRTPSTNLRVQY